LYIIIKYVYLKQDNIFSEAVKYNNIYLKKYVPTYRLIKKKEENIVSRIWMMSYNNPS